MHSCLAGWRNVRRVTGIWRQATAAADQSRRRDGAEPDLKLPLLNVNAPHIPDDTISLALLALREVMIALPLLRELQIIFSAVEFSGQIIGMQMGFTMAAIMDPGRTAPRARSCR